MSSQASIRTSAPGPFKGWIPYIWLIHPRQYPSVPSYASQIVCTCRGAIRCLQVFKQTSRSFAQPSACFHQTIEVLSITLNLGCQSIHCQRFPSSLPCHTCPEEPFSLLFDWWRCTLIVWAPSKLSPSPDSSVFECLCGTRSGVIQQVGHHFRGHKSAINLIDYDELSKRFLSFPR